MSQVQDVLRVEFRPDTLREARPPRPRSRTAPVTRRGVASAAVIGNYPPRMCGIATFTRDIHAGIAAASPSTRWRVVAMCDGRDYDFPEAVTHVIGQEDQAAYVATAQALNASGVEVVYLQHEFGIFGGPAGEHVLILLRLLRMPVITTLHTVLERPDANQKRVMDEIIRRSARVVVMANKGAEILRRVHPHSAGKVTVTPHGAPTREQAPTDAFKEKLGLAGYDVVTTFGLLGPGKGLETVVRALPEILARSPDAVYLVVGATHPNLVAEQGEAYRESIVDLARSLGVGHALRFINRFVSNDELVDILQATDVYVTPYLNEQQITSGTLSYALALGRPIVSTPYWHAAEALADDVGVLCGFGDAQAFGREISGLLTDDARRSAMSRRAYRAGAPSRWPNVGRAYIDLGVAGIIESETQRPAIDPSLRPSLTAVKRLFDDCGILQHARFRTPDRAHGYCVDDNARALLLAARLVALDGAAPGLRRQASTAAAFVEHAWNPVRGRFRNFMSYGREWLDEGGCDDCNARSLEAVFEAAVSPSSPELRDWAVDLGRRAFQHAGEWRSLRSLALVAKAARAGVGVVIERDEAVRVMTAAGDALMGGLAAHGPWFEPRLGYDNARLPEGLLIAGAYMRREDWIASGVAALEWLWERQTLRGVFCPVGTAAFDGAQADPEFDQQPIEALASIEACAAAFAATIDEAWLDRAAWAHDWFGGANLLGVALATPEDGGCFDGLTASGPNLNQGAESVLCRQLAAVAMRRLSGSDLQAVR
jgi:glycosyltransferase involved in cell wall biosynthesis